MKSKVIVVSGVTAGGKTTLINAIKKQLNNCSIVSFDDYSIDALPSAPDIFTPVKETVNQYDISDLLDDLKEKLDKFEYILVDFPFAKRHKNLNPYIDLSIYINTPLDIALARGILRDYSDGENISAVFDWLNIYLDKARPVFVDFQDYVMNSADLVIDGSLELDKKLEIAESKINGI
ncbi:nucleoside/nucleotide kinase family protein [Companilactobacillus jidongensis]|uniref:adenylylsulfate kinase n=1 Tax=Companilactobacillus jidongensis TaxID=2486006 RepID=UPI00177B7CAE|nr:adenylylsulfate kinase [Companilactobacillus jidongensis]